MIKLGDFGMKTLLEHFCMNKSKQAGMLYYTAPEVYNNTIEKKSDVWSLGITLIELAEGKNPFAGYPSKLVERVVCSGRIPSLSSPGWSDAFVDYVGKCLVRDVEERWSVEQLMSVSVFDEA